MKSAHPHNIPEKPVSKPVTVWDTDTPTAMKSYGRALVELARNDESVVCLGADLTDPTETDLFQQTFPDRFFNIGMAEANLMGIAAGMARSGDLPFVHTFGVFATRRPLDQISMQIAYPRTPVKIVGFMPGLTTPGGVTHQAIDDVAIMRVLPNMTIIEPADARQIEQAVLAAAEWDGPVYLRVKRGEAPVMDTHQEFTIGKVQTLVEGSDVVVFASGLMVTLALEAARRLQDDHIGVRVVNVHTIKPLDAVAVAQHASTVDAVVVAENHSMIGGLGSAVADVLMDAGVRTPFGRVGISDTFARGASPRCLFDEYGLSSAHIESAVRSALEGGRAQTQPGLAR